MEAARAELIRNLYTPTATFGEFRIFGIDGSILFSCLTLEDVVRPFGVKVKHSTAIFAGLYQITANRSPKFRRVLPYVIGTFGFTGIRLHPGLNIRNTSGCPLIGTKIDQKREEIFGGSQIEEELVALLKGKTIPFEVKNGLQVG